MKQYGDWNWKKEYRKSHGRLPDDKCEYPDCDCAVSFPEGHKPSEETECPRMMKPEPRSLGDAALKEFDEWKPKSEEIKQ